MTQLLPTIMTDAAAPSTAAVLKTSARLTSLLRHFTNVSGHDAASGQALDTRVSLEQLVSEREAFDNACRVSKVAAYWQRIVMAVVEAGGRRPLRHLQQLVLQLLGDDVPPQLVDETSALAVRQLAGCQQLQEADRQRLLTLLPMISRQQTDQLLQAVNDVTCELSDDTMTSLMSADLTSQSTTPPTPSFGHNLKLADLTEYEWSRDVPLPTAPSTPADSVEDLFGVLGNAAGGSNSHTLPKHSSVSCDRIQYGSQWLHDELRSAGVGGDDTTASVSDLSTSVINLLASDRTDDQLQNELFELLGVDCIDVIGRLFSHRSQIVTACSAENDAAAIPRHLAHKLSATVKKGGRCVPGGSVVVQTQRELEARKMLRREEKRLRRHGNATQLAGPGAGGGVGIKEADDQNSRFDADLAKTFREMEVLNAMRAPLFDSTSSAGSSDATRLTQQQKLPFVFDMLQSVRQSSAMIGGRKLCLPADCVWRDEKNYQSVEIPAVSTPPGEVGSQRVAVQSLDKLGRLAFQGVSELNRVQSVVFPAAYHSNENLLVCAPTGAGKTNVALLTVVHQLRQHMESGADNLNDFKVVYVAPMKALAAEMTASFGRRLRSLGVVVRECTGDMQLSKQQISTTHMLVTTPEKWDVLTRKSTGDVSLTQQVRLLIIDEVHLLHGDRGPVVEALVARTLRLVESSQSMIRIVGLSATLPNYIDVAHFLRVNPMKGLFFFDGRFRPVPLTQRFVGVRGVGTVKQMLEMDSVCYDQAHDMVSKGHQVMVFVHARNATVRTALALRDIAKRRDQLSAFSCAGGGGENGAGAKFGAAQQQMSRSRNKQLRELFDDGFSIHHAGMLRQDRSMVERMFSDGLIKVLCCTSTLAWGVNLPAHAVIIRGTDIYDAKHGSFVDVGALDVMQIFGRAGRPQFDASGHATIITSHAKLANYLSLLTNQCPIESSFVQPLADNLNAEICLGTVSTVDEAVEWLSYTYLYVRMRRNPHVYGIKPEQLRDDPLLDAKCRELIHTAATRLDAALMVRYDASTGYLNVTDHGRTASHFYVKCDTIETVNELLNSNMYQRDILAMLSRAHEFEQVKVRDDELDELDRHLQDDCEEPVLGGAENVHGKVNILLQTYISRGRVDSFSLVSDMNYIVQNAGRICRALFELCMDKKWSLMAGRALSCCLQLERRQWLSETPLRQCLGGGGGEAAALTVDLLDKLDARQQQLTVDVLRETPVRELGALIRDQRRAAAVQRAARHLPAVRPSASVQPITRRVLRVRLTLTPDFSWCDRLHGRVGEPFIAWVEDPSSDFMYHSERFLLARRLVVNGESHALVFTIPIFEPLPSQYLVRVVSDRWLGVEAVLPLTFQHLILPDLHPPHTDLLPLEPLPVTALQNVHYQTLYSFSHFNAVQTQIFHTLYHSDNSVVLGAPTGSGKTIAAELAILRLFNTQPHAKAVYIAPMKALVRERLADWQRRLGATSPLGRRVLELSGDVTPDASALCAADVIVSTPEKWDGVSRSWQTRDYVRKVALLVIDEIHLLGEERGPVLEVIVSRAAYISSHTKQTVRIVGLSTAMANAADLADWLGIKDVGMYNFRPSVRPVPLEVHIQGFPGKHYCPRMATMNKPAFKAIRTHSPDKPCLIFVASRRQTRITALDLIACLAAEVDAKQWLHMDEHELDELARDVRDPNLRLTLAFGIGIHHAGLVEYDRKLVESLFVDQKIQVLVATATLAWGVNFPAHLVIVKGTEYFDGKQKRYVDFPVTDVLQMMGRAGRPQYDDHGVAVVLVHDIKKHFYKHFLYEPFPVESSLLQVFADHLNSEIVAGTVTSRQDAIDYLTWTFLFRRVLRNPSYYGLESTDGDSVNRFLSSVVDGVLSELTNSGCVDIDEDNSGVHATTRGCIASYYYVGHTTVELFASRLSQCRSIADAMTTLSDAGEFSQLPVRHNEELTNAEMARASRLPVSSELLDSPHVKTLLLLAAHCSRAPMPVADYVTDLRSVLDQAVRLVQAMIDTAAEHGWLPATLAVIHTAQQIYQARWASDSALLCLPHVDEAVLSAMTGAGVSCLPAAVAVASRGAAAADRLRDRLLLRLDPWQVDEMLAVLRRLPLLTIHMWLEDSANDDVTTNDVTGDDPPAEAASKRRSVASLAFDGRSCRGADGRPANADWLQLHADRSYSLCVQLSVTSGAQSGGRGDAYTPCFHKSRQEGWLLVLGECDSAQLLALRRVGAVGGGGGGGSARGKRPSRSITVRLAFDAPSSAGRRVFRLFVMSDCYLGLDQQYDICVEVV